jgi:hypothetical protein
VKGFCEIGSGRTICPVGFKLKSSWSLPPE